MLYLLDNVSCIYANVLYTLIVYIYSNCIRYIKSNMNDWHIISDNVCTKIDVLHNLINIREGNISCDGFTRE